MPKKRQTEKSQPPRISLHSQMPAALKTAIDLHSRALQSYRSLLSQFPAEERPDKLCKLRNAQDLSALHARINLLNAEINTLHRLSASKKTKDASLAQRQETTKSMLPSTAREVIPEVIIPAHGFGWENSADHSCAITGDNTDETRRSVSSAVRFVCGACMLTGVNGVRPRYSL
jgi:uncharacterized small protein (DUF1192 family)